MTRVLLLALALFVVFGTAAVFQVRTRMGAARLGSDLSYTLDNRGNASVEMTEKTYFVDAETERNFDGLVVKTGRPDAERFGTGIRTSLSSVAERMERPTFELGEFEASFLKTSDYGARVYTFRWASFAVERDGAWVVDFRMSDPVKLTKDSSLSIVIPRGTELLKAEPAPAAVDGDRLVWRGAGEIPWPYVEYR